MFSNMEGLSVKNTFIHFQFGDSVVAHNARRSRSEPPCSRAMSEHHDHRSMSKSEASTCNSTTCSSSGGCGGDGGSGSSSSRSGSTRTSTSSGSSTNEEFAENCEDNDSKASKQKQSRPCKAQRDAFRKYVDNLKKQLSENPQAFSLEDVAIPKRFCRPGAKNKVATILAVFLKEVCGPVAHSAI